MGHHRLSKGGKEKRINLEVEVNLKREAKRSIIPLQKI